MQRSVGKERGWQEFPFLFAPCRSLFTWDMETLKTRTVGGCENRGRSFVLGQVCKICGEFFSLSLNKVAVFRSVRRM